MPKTRPAKRNEYKKQGNYHVFKYENMSNDLQISSAPPINNVIDFKNNSELVKSFKDKLTLDAELLSDNSEKTRQAISNKKRGVNKIPRPPNAFIIYRREM